MRIIIEDATTFEFLMANGRWTKEAGRAEAFKNATMAKARGASVPIDRFNVVGSFAAWPQLINLDEGFGTSRSNASATA